MLSTGSLPATANTNQGSSSLAAALAHPEGLAIPLSTPEVHTSQRLATDQVEDPVQGCPRRRLTLGDPRLVAMTWENTMKAQGTPLKRRE